MEIKTIYNANDIVFYLSNDKKYCNDDKILKDGEVFVVKAQIGKITIEVRGDGNYRIKYEVYVKLPSGVRTDVVLEEFLAPDTTQLGLNVTNRYYLSGDKKK